MDDDLTPLGQLLESAREARRPKLSQNAVAKAANTSPTTYRRVIKGVARLGGRDVPFDGAPDSIARIALVLGVTASALEGAGRDDVAAELRAIELTGEPVPLVHLKARGHRSDIPSDDELRASALQPATAEAIINMRNRIARWIAEGDETLIRRGDRVTEALDEERDIG